MKVIITGANGTMGKNVAAAVESGKFNTETAAYISRSFVTDADAKKYASITEFSGDADCVIDFSNHNGTKELTEYCAARKIPVVIATTGHTPEELDMIRKAAESTPVFLAYNTSIGVAVVGDLAKRAAAAFPEADIEIIERHHNRKGDAPSGTALTLANKIREVRTEAELVMGRSGAMKRQQGEIGIHAVRYGNEVGTHEIIISNGSETITIKHEAENRILFAEGAVKAAEWLVSQPAGLYGMAEMMAG